MVGDLSPKWAEQRFVKFVSDEDERKSSTRFKLDVVQTPIVSRYRFLLINKNITPRLCIVVSRNLADIIRMCARLRGHRRRESCL